MNTQIITSEIPPQTDTDGIKLQEQLSFSENSCKLQLKINFLESEYYNSDCLSLINIGGTKSEKGRIELKNFGVTNGVGGSYCGTEIGLLGTTNTTYNPKLGDTIIAIINPENNFIQSLYPVSGKTQNQITSQIKDINIPYCEIENITTVSNVNIQTNNNIFFGFLITLCFIIIGTLLFKHFKQ